MVREIAKKEGKKNTHKNLTYGWVFGLGKMVRIVGPDDVKEGMKKALADITARYEE